MDWALIVVLQVILQPSLSVLFTVETERATYEAPFGGDVVMGCSFQPRLSNPPADLKVTWHWISSTSVRDVYRMDNWTEHTATQDPDYQGRVKLLTEELQGGWAKLQISRLRINDSGTYQCLVQTGEGADYKTITLSVVSPYKLVTKHIEKAAEEDEVLLTCQSVGYPESSVTWQDGRQQRLSPDTNAVSTPDQLFNVTSQIHVRSSDTNNYTCLFTHDGHSATFHIPDEIPVPHVQNDAAIIVLCIGVIMIVIIVAVLMYRRQKVFQRCHLPSDPEQGQDKDKEEEKHEFVTGETRHRLSLPAGSTEENLGVFLRGHYSDLSREVRHRRDALEELPLQNNKGQPVSLLALLPEAGETLFLEGPPGSGKTTVAHILVSSWTEEPMQALSNLPDLSTLPLLLYVDCSKAKGDLFQEIVIQLSLAGGTEDELRTVLTRPGEVLLLLDDYREGNQLFDESLRMFLMQKGGCRVLVMARPGHCPTLKGTVETERVLQLQTV